MKKIKIEKIPKYYIDLYPEDYNTNNHWVDGIRPDDYSEVSRRCNTKYWIDKFHDDYDRVTLDSKDISWLIQASSIGVCTGRFPKSFSEELDDICSRCNIPGDGTTPYFVRTENVSLKYGQHGVGPYFSFRQIIESLVSCTATHTPISRDTTDIIIYLLPWLSIMDESKEFRMFIHNNEVSAISQQNCYKVYEWFESSTQKELIDMTSSMMSYFENVIRKRITHISSYTVDIALCGKDWYFIEVNSFGSEYAAGSALFHWIHDRDLLYGNEDEVVLRYVV